MGVRRFQIYSALVQVLLLRHISTSMAMQEGEKGLLLACFLIFYLTAQAGVDAELPGAL